MKTIVSVVCALVLVAACKQERPAGTSAPIRVAAAADLAFAFKEMGKEFESQTGKPVEFTFGSTGNLAKQISEGAPYDVFAAANVSYVETVVKNGACDATTKAIYGRGRIVVWSAKDGVAPATKLGDLADARFAKIAIANPEHAPYGKAAKQALESAKLWDTVQPRIVYGENVQQTLQFAQTGNTEASIVALSLALMAKEGTYFVIEDTLHAPIEQALVACKRGTNLDTAKQFATFVGSERGRAIMKRYGFLLPGEALVQN